MLLARAPSPPPPLALAASYSTNPERALRIRITSSSRAAVATASAAAKPAASSRFEQKRKQVASVANPLVKHCVKLRLSAAYRRSCLRLLLVGLAPILEMCRFELDAIDYLLLLDGVEVPEELREFSGDIVFVSAAVMKKVSGMQSVDSTEAIAVMYMPRHFRDLGSHEDGVALDGLFNYPKRILVLDGIQDPGNLGTLIRSACAFKWDGVFLLPACCDPFNEKALRAARGASLQLPIVSGTWHDLHELTAKYNMKMMAGHPESSGDASKGIHSLSKELADALLNEPLCLVLGSEGNGLSSETLQACELVNIPMEVTIWDISCLFQKDTWTVSCPVVEVAYPDTLIPLCSKTVNETLMVGVPSPHAIWHFAVFGRLGVSQCAGKGHGLVWFGRVDRSVIADRIALGGH